MFNFIEDIQKEIPTDDSASLGEQVILYGLVYDLKPKMIVETGTHKGLSTLWMAHALYDAGVEAEIHTADPNNWGARGNFRKFPELEKYITIHETRGDQMEIEDEIDFIFLDGLHEKDEVLSEMEHLMPHMAKDCVVVFHDCKKDNKLVGVNAAVKELKLKNIALATHNYIRIASPIDPV